MRVQANSRVARTASARTAREYLRSAPAAARARTWVENMPPGPVQEAARGPLHLD
ncbi:MAG: hypothetical protein JWL81_1467 [Verrucomicrobiales bacterium]|nr:hypothetical protein [Verrucomicrobiales bacterium]